MTKAQLIQTFTEGDKVRITNHYITIQDHPCYGTRETTITRISSAGFTTEDGGHIKWRKAGEMSGDGVQTLIIGDRPDGEPGPFMTIERAA